MMKNETTIGDAEMTKAQKDTLKGYEKNRILYERAGWRIRYVVNMLEGGRVSYFEEFRKKIKNTFAEHNHKRSSEILKNGKTVRNWSYKYDPDMENN